MAGAGGYEGPTIPGGGVGRLGVQRCVDMLRFILRDRPPPPPPSDVDASEPIAERIRAIGGVSVLWWYGQGPFFACARHCGENHAASARTLGDAFLQLEEDLRARNRSIIREAFRLL